MQRTDVAQLLLTATTLWPRTFVAPQNEEEFKLVEGIWMRMLSDFPREAIEVAMMEWGDHWPPNPFELRVATQNQIARAHGETPIPSVDEAWIEFKRCYRSDYDGDFEWSHPAIASAARALGCREFGQSLEADEMAWRAHFIKLYESATHRFVEETRVKPPAVEAWHKSIEQQKPELES